MQFGLNTYHITDRYGWYESGEKNSRSLVYSTKDIIKQGFRHVELLLDVGSKDTEVLNAEVIERLHEFTVVDHIGFSAHLPYKYVDIGSLNEAIRKTSVELILTAIKIANQIGIDRLVLHPVGAESKPFDLSFYPASKNVKEKIINEMVDQIRLSLREIVGAIDSHRLCLENLPYIDFDPFIPLIDEFDLGVCMDVGHCILRHDDPLEFIARFSKQLGVVHLHDVADFRTKPGVMKLLDHEPLGTGIVDVKSILRGLQAIDFDGPVVLEHLEESKALQSVAFLKRLIHSDFPELSDFLGDYKQG
jgi:sugar phosphate isomerase/epimerase